MELAMLWVLNFSDGEHSLLDIAERSGYPFGRILEAAELLTEHGLLEECHLNKEASLT
jgi:aminopeptidase-like protein